VRSAIVPIPAVSRIEVDALHVVSGLACRAAQFAEKGRARALEKQKTFAHGLRVSRATIRRKGEGLRSLRHANSSCTARSGEQKLRVTRLT